MEELNSGIVEELKTKRTEILEKQAAAKVELERVKHQIWDKERSVESGNAGLTGRNGELVEAERALRGSEKMRKLSRAIYRSIKIPVMRGFWRRRLRPWSEASRTARSRRASWWRFGPTT